MAEVDRVADFVNSQRIQLTGSVIGLQGTLVHRTRHFFHRDDRNNRQ